MSILDAKDIDRKHQEDLERIKNFCLMDDDFMTKVFENNVECTELVLRILLENPALSVKSVRGQYSIKNLQGHSVRLDVYANDDTGKDYDIEIQRSDKGAAPQRARYNSSVIDANALLAGQEYDRLPETYVIFITENDLIGLGKPIYHIDRTIRENGEQFGDGSHILYVNGEYDGKNSIGKLMHDFRCKNPDDMNYKELADRTRYFKEDEEGRGVMCRAIEKMREEERLEEKRETVLRMLEDDELSLEKIAQYSGLSLEEVTKLAKENAVLV